MAQLSLAALAAHLETIELTESLFPGDGELSLSESTAAALPTLRSWIESGSPQPADAPAPTEELALTIQLALDQHDAATTFVLPLQVRLPLVEPKDPALVLPDDAQTPAAVVHATQPPWMSRTAHDQLAATLPKPGDGGAASNVDLLLAAIDHIRSITPSLLPAPSPPPSTVDRARGGRKRPSPGDNSGDEPEYRVWFWFPSLSTREKRDDMVNWAPEYGLTGFVLAGKPALLCVEGTESNVQAYLSDIKANSWADIPSFQKKVSERLRTPLTTTAATAPPPPPITSSSALPPDPTSHRLFASMDEITSLIPKGGYRGHKPEMGDVRDYLAGKGLAEAFGLVVGGGQFS